MSLVYDSRWLSLDSTGNPIVGATLTVYTAGTTTPAAIWRDAALTVAMTNPTSGADKADASGRFPQIFAAEGALFDIVEKNAVGTTIGNYLSVTSLGADLGVFSRDFTNSRFSVSGSGGIVEVEAGDPSPDNVGGKMRVGGWAGTQADEIDIDAALVNVTGRLKEKTYKLPSIVRTEATTFTGATSVIIPLTNDPAGVRGWQIDLLDFALLTADDTVRARLSYDGGATFKSGATDYAYYSTYKGAVNAIAADAEMVLFTSIEHTSVPKGRASIRISSPLTTDAVVLQGTASLYNNTDQTPFFYLASAFGLGGYGRPTHIKLFCNTSTIAGLYRVLPERGFGET